MPVEAKPLFRPDVVARRMRGFVLPELGDTAQGVLANWATLIGGPGFASYREQDLLPDFLSEVFGGLLGYTGPASGALRYTLARETHVEVEGEFADAVLGEFGAAKRPVVAVEGKGPRDPLDRPFGGRRLSAVEQGYRYATNLPCDWIVVTNIAEVRLYHKGSDQRTYERFETARLATDEDHLRRFVYLLGAERVVPQVGENHLRDLLTASERAHLEKFREKLEPRPETWDEKRNGRWPGRKPGPYAWYEIQDTVAYWELLERPKILYQEIQFHPAYALDQQGLFANNKVLLLPTSDLYLLAVLNSPFLWWHNWRFLIHLKDEALSPAGCNARFYQR